MYLRHRRGEFDNAQIIRVVALHAERFARPRIGDGITAAALAAYGANGCDCDSAFAGRHRVFAAAQQAQLRHHRHRAGQRRKVAVCRARFNGERYRARVLVVADDYQGARPVVALAFVMNPHRQIIRVVAAPCYECRHPRVEPAGDSDGRKSYLRVRGLRREDGAGQEVNIQSADGDKLARHRRRSRVFVLVADEQCHRRRPRTRRAQQYLRFVVVNANFGLYVRRVVLRESIVCQNITAARRDKPFKSRRVADGDDVVVRKPLARRYVRRRPRIKNQCRRYRLPARDNRAVRYFINKTPRAGARDKRQVVGDENNPRSVNADIGNFTPFRQIFVFRAFNVFAAAGDARRLQCRVCALQCAAAGDGHRRQQSRAQTLQCRQRHRHRRRRGRVVVRVVGEDRDRHRVCVDGVKPQRAVRADVRAAVVDSAAADRKRKLVIAQTAARRRRQYRFCFADKITQLNAAADARFNIRRVHYRQFKFGGRV